MRVPGWHQETEVRGLASAYRDKHRSGHCGLAVKRVIGDGHLNVLSEFSL